MALWTSLVGIVCLAAVATAVTVARQGRPGPKRRSLYETEDGERANPFAAVSAGAAARDDCDECGATLDSPSEGFCVSCGHAVLGDD